MRTVTGGETTTLALTNRAHVLRVKVANGSGTMIDYSSWVESVSIDHDVDQPVGGCTITFTRASGTLASLAPLRTDSTLNVNDVAAYAPALDLNRSVTVEVTTNPIGTAPVAGDYKLMFKGTIDVVNFEHSPVSIICRDLGAPLVDRWLEAEATYGSGGGTAIQTVMQSILDDVFGGAVYTLYVPVSPGFNVITYRQQRMSVMDALQDLVQLIGWDVRFKWDDGTSAFRLTLSEPPRTKTTPDYTFAPSTYFDITQANLDITNIRNVVTGSYRNSANLGNRATVTVSDSASITKYGRRFFYIQEADVSPIDTSAEMTTMVTAALADLKDPKTEQDVDMPFFWPADISDLYRYSANLVHYNSNQDIAVVELTHELSQGHYRTRVKVRGTPIGQYATWLGRGGTMGGGGPGGAAFAPYPFISPRNTEANDSTWDLRFDSLLGSGGGGTNLTYTVKSKATFGTETTVSSGNASAFPLDLTITRDPKQDKVITLRVTDAATGMFAEDKFTVPAFVAGISATGTIIGSQIDAASVGPTQTQGRFRCNLTKSGDQTGIVTGTHTTLSWDTEAADVGTLHDNVTNNSRITVPTGGNVGAWLITLQVQWDNDATGIRRIYINKNATRIGTVVGPPAGGAIDTTQNLSAFDPAPTVGDYYEARVEQTSGTNRSVVATNSFFAALHLW